MRETDAEALRILVDELRRNVRAGDFTKSEIQKEVWANRQLLPEDGFHRLSIHTLSWEYFHSRGDQDAAAARLRDGQVVESAVRLVEEWSQAPGRFVEAEFPPDLPDEERRRRYNLWRQRAVGSLAWCMVSHQRRESGWKELLASVESFIDVCLGSAGFGCTGTRARFHFIRAQIHESNNETPEAVSDYDRSLHYCIKRANERLGSGQSDGQQEIERAFAIYSLGKLKLRLGQIDFEMGQLASAKGHAREAGLLLRVSRDPFLPEMANLLSYCIERQESTFYARGGDVVARMESVREGLQEHRPFFLKASIEQLITRVYLTGAQPGGSAGRAETLTAAHTELKNLSSQARQLGLPDLQLLGLLASARTLLRLGDTERARAVVGDAHRIAVTGKDKAEVLFVEGKTWVAQATRAAGSGKVLEERKYSEEALDKFQAALRMNHPSANFQLACEERIVSLLLKAGQVIEAERLLKRAREHGKHVEDTFLRARLEALFAEIDEMRYSEFTYGPGFDVDSAKEEVINKYLFNLQRRLGVDLHELLSRFSEFKEEVAPLSYDKLKSLMRRKKGASA